MLMFAQPKLFHTIRVFYSCLGLALLLYYTNICHSETPKIAERLSINWNKEVMVSRSTPTLQVVTNPMLNQGSAIHDNSFAALKSLGADYVRFVPWVPYPQIAVAELQPPTSERTFWDFTHADAITKDFLGATAGHSVVMNFSTIPAWMFKTDEPVQYPSDPNTVVWNYTQGTELNDPSGKQLGDYFARLFSWYTKGGFYDENGKYFSSGYYYKFPYWEVLNEVDGEHTTTPDDYNKRYDAIVKAVHTVSPDTKFIGLALGSSSKNPHYYEKFLNPENHESGIPLDFISYHFYAVPDKSESPATWQFSFFDQADGFIATSRFIIAIRDRLSPPTKLAANELGVILPSDVQEVIAGKALPDAIPHRYWNASAALFAYLFEQLSMQGVDIIGESQLVGYPSQFPSVSMINYDTGKPNARYWVLWLLKNNFHPGDKIVSSAEPGFGVSTPLRYEGFITPQGKKVLIVNKTNEYQMMEITQEMKGSSATVVDEVSGDDEPKTVKVENDLKLGPYAVAVLTLP